MFLCYNPFMPAEAYVGGSKGGIPRSIFTPEGFNGILKGNSGSPLFVDLKPGSVRIWDLVWNCHFIAGVEAGVLSIDAWTKGYNGSDMKHPDLYFSQLFDESMAHFKRSGVDISSVLCEWESDWAENRTSDLYWEFMSRIGESPTEEEMKNAAKDTTAGAILARHGFGMVDTVEIRRFQGKEKIVASFIKAQEPVPVPV